MRWLTRNVPYVRKEKDKQLSISAEYIRQAQRKSDGVLFFSLENLILRGRRRINSYLCRIYIYISYITGI